MKMLLLHELAHIRTGVTLRGRDATVPNPKGSCLMIRIGDISNEGLLEVPELLRIQPAERIKKDLFLRAGDILFPNRGTRHTAYVFDRGESNVIVGAQFYIIRPNAQLVLPEYLAWYLRSESASQHFQSVRRGSLVQTLQRADVEALQIPIPPLDTQNALIELDRLDSQERVLTERLSSLRSAQLQQALLRLPEET
jgi:Type I restriction modification DNA specificity domain